LSKLLPQYDLHCKYITEETINEDERNRKHFHLMIADTLLHNTKGISLPVIETHENEDSLGNGDLMVKVKLDGKKKEEKGKKMGW
jgi:hypothetical protein